MSVGPNISRWLVPASGRGERRRWGALFSGWSGRKVVRFCCVLAMAGACWLAMGFVAFSVMRLIER